MADAPKPQQPLQETGVVHTPKTEIVDFEFEDLFPALPMNLEHFDLWSEQRWKSTLSKEELNQCCARCNEIGHSDEHCPYPIINLMAPDLSAGPEQVKPVVWKPAKGKYRCSRCGRRGHNRRTCHGPVFY
ncbi:hypothetical protein PTKIN_Ptkin15bG0035300 [Pterospermum kingtungense]